MDSSIDSIQSLSFSQQAEFTLIYPLLKDIIEENDFQTRRELSLYPGSSAENKIKTIISLSNRLNKQQKNCIDLSFFEKFERFLRAAGKRDHFIHQFEVLLLGWSIIRHHLETSKNNQYNQVELFNWWLITSLSHDIGYPITATSEILGTLAKLYSFSSTRKLGIFFKATNSKLEKLLKQKGCYILEKFFKKRRSYILDAKSEIFDFIEKSIFNVAKNEAQTRQIIKALQTNLDHGYNSSILLLENLYSSYHDKCDLENNPLIYMAIAAISLHNLPAKEYKETINNIDINLNPFAYVLYIADCLQEWTRPTSLESDYPIFILDKFVAHVDGNIYIKFILKHNLWTDKLVEKQIKYIEDKEAQINALDYSNQAFKIIIEYACTNEHLNGKQISLPKIIAFS